MISVWSAQKRQAFDYDAAGLEVDRLAGACQIVGALAFDLEGREGWRDLLDVANEGRQGAADRLVGGTKVAGGSDLALGIFRRARLPEAEREAVFLPAVHDEGHGLGRLAQGNRQHAAGQRIERSAMARLPRAEQAAHTADRGGRPQPHRLVEDHPAVDLVARLPAAHRLGGLSALTRP